MGPHHLTNHLTRSLFKNLVIPRFKQWLVELCLPPWMNECLFVCEREREREIERERDREIDYIQAENIVNFQLQVTSHC